MRATSLAFAAVAAGLSAAATSATEFHRALVAPPRPPQARGHRQGRRFNFGMPALGASASWSGRRNGDNPAGTKMVKKAMRGQLGMGKPR